FPYPFSGTRTHQDHACSPVVLTEYRDETRDSLLPRLLLSQQPDMADEPLIDRRTYFERTAVGQTDDWRTEWNLGGSHPAETEERPLEDPSELRGREQVADLYGQNRKRQRQHQRQQRRAIQPLEPEAQTSRAPTVRSRRNVELARYRGQFRNRRRH